MKKYFLYLLAVVFILNISGCTNNSSDHVSQSTTVMEDNTEETAPTVNPDLITLEEMGNNTEEDFLTLSPGDVIPANCEYIIYAPSKDDRVTLHGGETIPENVTNRDVFKTPCFKYTFYEEYAIDPKEFPEDVRPGWQISAVVDSSALRTYCNENNIDLGKPFYELQKILPEEYCYSKYPEKFFEKINGFDVISAKELFMGNPFIAYSPKLPDSILDMTMTYLGSSLHEVKLPPNVLNLDNAFNSTYKLRRPPEIPESVRNMRSAFAYSGITHFPDLSHCINLTNMEETFNFLISFKMEEPCIIPENVKTVKGCFQASPNIEMTVELNNNPDLIWDNIFRGSNYTGITIKGKNPVIQEIVNKYPEIKRIW